MKLTVLFTLALAATARLQAGGRSQLTHSHHLAIKVLEPKEEEEGTHFGDTECPCIGFDNIDGETMMQVDVNVDADAEESEKMQVAYPADVGARCKAWDDGTHPLCKDGAKPGKGNEWCGQAWCYVDPCRCGIDVLPKMSMWMPGVTYRGKPLFWSYATCGGKDMFTKKKPKVGSPKCRCVGFAGVDGTTEITMTDGKVVDYPADMGTTCQAWDQDKHPACKGADPPSWCKANWCYVDPCECELPGDIVPKISGYLPMATFTGKNLYYSYETCGSPDNYTKTMNLDACVNQATKEECDKNYRCAWTGVRCLGTELVHHPLCKEAGARAQEEDKKKKDKSGAASWRPLSLLFGAAVAAAAVRA